MLVIEDDKLIKRNKRLGQIISIVAVAILIGGMYITFTMPDRFGLSLTALLVGFILSQIGIYFTNRFARPPRPDQQISNALKGLDKRYALFHYTTPASHLLIGPAGVWILRPKFVKGNIVYQRNKWRQKNAGFLSGYLRLFAQEGIGRPDLEYYSEKRALQQILERHLDEEEMPDIHGAVVFTHPDATVNIEEEDDLPVTTMHGNKLKDFIRKEAKNSTTSQTVTDKIIDIFKRE